MSTKRRVRIVNTTGNPAHTEILDADTNEPFVYVTQVDMHLSRNDNQVVLTLALTPFDLTVDAILGNEQDVRSAITRHRDRIKELMAMLDEA